MAQDTGPIETRVIDTAQGPAVELPPEFGIEPGMSVTVEKVGRYIYIRPVKQADEPDANTNLRNLVAELRTIWKDAPDHPDRGKRHAIEFPERTGL